jgi:hypothetical protein
MANYFDWDDDPSGRVARKNEYFQNAAGAAPLPRAAQGPGYASATRFDAAGNVDWDSIPRIQDTAQFSAPPGVAAGGGGVLPRATTSYPAAPTAPADTAARLRQALFGGGADRAIQARLGQAPTDTLYPFNYQNRTPIGQAAQSWGEFNRNKTQQAAEYGLIQAPMHSEVNIQRLMNQRGNMALSPQARAAAGRDLYAIAALSQARAPGTREDYENLPRSGAGALPRMPAANQYNTYTDDDGNAYSMRADGTLFNPVTGDPPPTGARLRSVGQANLTSLAGYRTGTLAVQQKRAEASIEAAERKLDVELKKLEQGDKSLEMKERVIGLQADRNIAYVRGVEANIDNDGRRTELQEKMAAQREQVAAQAAEAEGVQALAAMGLSQAELMRSYDSMTRFNRNVPPEELDATLDVLQTYNSLLRRYSQRVSAAPAAPAAPAASAASAAPAQTPVAPPPAAPVPGRIR